MSGEFNPNQTIPDLMENLGISKLQTETERQAYLQELSPERFLGDIALVSATARGVTPAQNTPEASRNIRVYEGDNSLERAAGVLYVPPKRKYGQQAIADSLEIAKQLPSSEHAGALMRLMITLAHIQLDGNGATSRFYHRLITKGYAGTEAANVQYQKLLGPGDIPKAGHREIQWHAAFAEYHAGKISAEKKLAFTPAGYTLAQWQGDKLSQFPFLAHGKGVYMVERNFATAFDLDFMTATGRNVRDYTIDVRRGLRKRKYVDTKKLLLNTRVEESSLAQQIGDTHKTAYLNAVNNHFNGSSHPAFRHINNVL